MGLLDSILGNLTGAAAGNAARGGSVSPLTKALMMLLAAKAYQHYTSRPQGGTTTAGGAIAGGPSPQMGGGMGPAAGGGLGGMLGGAGSSGLGGLLGGGLGGILGGLVGGGGLSTIVDQFRNTGHGHVIDSWVGRGQNEPIDTSQLGRAWS